MDELQLLLARKSLLEVRSGFLLIVLVFLPIFVKNSAVFAWLMIYPLKKVTKNHCTSHLYFQTVGPDAKL